MRALGLIGVLLALGAGYFVYNAQLTQSGAMTAPPQQQIDVTGIRAALLEIGQAQRMYVNAHGAYGTLEQLRADGAPELGTDRRGYSFDVEPNGAQSFKATARAVDSSKSDWPTLTIDATMQVTSSR
jgi:hypothetical protein